MVKGSGSYERSLTATVLGSLSARADFGNLQLIVTVLGSSLHDWGGSLKLNAVWTIFIHIKGILPLCPIEGIAWTMFSPINGILLPGQCSVP